MSAWLIVFVGGIYAIICLEQAIKGNTGMAVCYFGYAVGNVGLWKMTQ